MPQRRSYGSNSRYGRKKWKRVTKACTETLLPEQEAEADFLSSLILILIIIVLVGLVWFISGPRSNMNRMPNEVPTITKS